eukprot:scaffold47358_cov66-Phaeocystis_antarctica.AAC.5
MAVGKRVVVDAGMRHGRRAVFAPHPIDVVDAQRVVAQDDHMRLGMLRVRAHLDGDRLDVRQALAILHHLRGARPSGAHVDLRPDRAGDGRVVEDADAVHEELVARERPHVRVVKDLSRRRRGRWRRRRGRPPHRRRRGSRRGGRSAGVYRRGGSRGGGRRNGGRAGYD